MLSGFLDCSSLASASSISRLVQSACELGQQDVSGSGEGLKSGSTCRQFILKAGAKEPFTRFLLCVLDKFLGLSESGFARLLKADTDLAAC